MSPTRIPLVIAGAGGLGREVAHLVAAINQVPGPPTYDLLGYLDQAGQRPALRHPLLGDESWAEAHLSRQVQFVVAVGTPSLRRWIAERLETSGFEAATLIHPNVQIGSNVRLGAGCLLCGGSSLTVDIELGRHCLVNLHCTIGHDAHLADFATLHPGAHLSGASRVGAEAEVGTGAVLLPGVQLGAGSVLGAGAVLTKHAAPDQTWVGVPARPLL
jgi:sugar O-acyltransferase (sialic acid O-acetyltransferase NeuD family)